MHLTCSYNAKSLYLLDIKNDIPIDIIKASFYLHALQNYQGFINLLIKGMDGQSRILLRSQAETIFKLAAINNKNDLLKELEKISENGQPQRRHPPGLSHRSPAPDHPASPPRGGRPRGRRLLSEPDALR